MKTVCLICGRARVVPTHGVGDTDCPCVGGREFSNIKRIFVPGLGYTLKDGTHVTTMPCGRLIPEHLAVA